MADRLRWAGLALVLLLATQVPAAAQTGQPGGPPQSGAPQAARRAVMPYAVSGVAVERTAASAGAARAEAFDEATRQAFQRLVRRLVVAPAADRVPTPSIAQLQEYVRDIEVADEKSSATRYIARFTVRFKPEPVRSFLRASGAQFSEVASRPVLVLPIAEQGDSRTLWQDPNPWRDVWHTRTQRDGLVPFVVPTGELQDVGTITVEQAVSGDSQRLRALASRYGAGDVIVTVARLPTEGAADVQVQTTRHGAAGPQTSVERIKGNPGDSSAALLGRAADAVAVQTEERWKQENLFVVGREQSLEASIPLRTLKDWTEVRARLGRSPAIKRVDVLELSRVEARVRLTFVGEEAQLAQILSQQDLRLAAQGAQRVILPPGVGTP
jgi:hypothetical protein